MSSTLALSSDDLKKVALIIINILGDPELVIHFFKFYIPINRDYILELSRSFHCSLRLKPSDRWSRLNDLCKKKEFSKISPNSSVPITCTLPIDGDRWRAQKMILTQIRYTRGYFIRCNADYYSMPKDDTTKPSEKIRLINHMGVYYECKNVREAYKEYLEYEEDLDNNDLPEYYFYQESPRLVYNSENISDYQILN